MDVVGSEIGQKMRSAIKAKLTELGCYVDDELPDYVMVMVANKRTRAQMEDDLQLFLGDNTELFVNWLHQVLKKLQEVTVSTPLAVAEPEKSKETERSAIKEHKSKEKKTKDKVKKSDLKKAKKKDKVKLHRKKEEKKTHKSKKKSKHHEMIRPNIPPLLMNMEKDSEPSITDVFAGQILKNHGITLDVTKDEPKQDSKPIVKEIKRPILPIIDPATILSEPEISEPSQDNTDQEPMLTNNAPREEQMDEINKIEAKIQGLKQKLVEQLDSMSDDEDFLNIRTEAEELMNDFAEDVFQEISEQAPTISTPPIEKSPTLPPAPTFPKPIEIPEPAKDPIETLPHIELKLPKRPVRERLGVREELKKVMQVKPKDARAVSPERFTPDREPVFRPQTKTAKSRLGELPETQKRHSATDDAVSEKSDSSTKRLTSRVSVLESRPPRSSCASVVRVRPRPRVSAPASNLLLKAVADAHRSLLNIPPKLDSEPQKVKRALVLPMRRCVDAQKIVIQVPGGDNSQETGDSISLGDNDSDDDKSSKVASDADKDEYIPAPVTKKITNNEYTPSRRHEGRTSTRKNDTLIIETINIHNPSINKDKNTQFIVTMDGFSPNAFLAKKLRTEGLLNDDDEEKQKNPTEEPKPKEIVSEMSRNEMKIEEPESVQKKRLSNTSEESDTQVIIMKDIRKSAEDNDNRKRADERIDKRRNTEESNDKRKSAEESNDKRKSPEETDDKIKSAEERVDKRKSVEERIDKRKSVEEIIDKGKSTEEIDKRKSVEDNCEKRKSIELTTIDDAPPVKKRKASPIVFDVSNKEKDVERVRQRTESASSDSHVIVTTVTNSHKYDSVPPLSAAERKQVWCRSFPLCRYGSSCAFAHPRCKFAAACTRRGCVYSHSLTALAQPAVTAAPAPSLASHVVPAANYKSISTVVPNMCKYYPSCVNPLCHYYHPKPCRYGKACGNKLECNFYHADAPQAKWRYPV